MDWSRILSVAFFITFLSAGIRFAVPLLLASLGEIVNELAGSLSVAIEGIMLFGALAAFFGSFYTGSPWIGMIFATAVGAIAGTFLALMYIKIQSHQIVTGVMFNIFALAATSLIYRAVMGITLVPSTAVKFESLSVPILKDIPFLGEILSSQNITFYIAIFLAIAIGIFLYRTKAGLELRVVGEHPKTADTMGIDVNKIRFLSLVFAGAMNGLAGSVIVLGALGFFRDNIIAGRGFIALAIVIFGRWNPYVAIAASFAFGVADALALSLQAFKIPVPTQLILMLPYLMTALVMTGIFGKVRPPASMQKPYIRE